MKIDSFVVRGNELIIDISSCSEIDLLKVTERALSEDGSKVLASRIECNDNAGKNKFTVFVELPEDGTDAVVIEITYSKNDKILVEKVNLSAEHFVDLPERHSDLETSAYVARQSAISGRNSISTRCTMSVVFGYNCIDLGEERLISESRSILEESLSLTDSLNLTNHVRTDRYNVQLSLLTVMWHIAIGQNDYGFFSRCASCIYGNWLKDESKLEKINGSLAFNLVKFINATGIVLYKFGKSHEAEVLLNKALDVFSYAAQDFRLNNKNINEFSVLSAVHKDVVRSLFIRNLIAGRDLPVGRFSYDLLSEEKENINIDSFIQTVFRAKAGKEFLVTSLRELDSQSFDSELGNFIESLG